MSSTAWISSKNSSDLHQNGWVRVGEWVQVLENRLGGSVRQVGGGAEWGSEEKWGKWVNGSWLSSFESATKEVLEQDSHS